MTASSTATVVAVDFGATSIRVCRVALGDGPPELAVVHRYEHSPVFSDGALRWDWVRLVEEMEQGLVVAVEPGDVASIGIDTWAVDYGLLDRRGALLSPPISYRDQRTDGYRTVVDRVGEATLYATTGLQLQPFNTIFQVAAHDRDELRQARSLLTLPELLVRHLTGTIASERTSAGCTGLVDITAGDWSHSLAEAVGLDPAVLPPIVGAGRYVGRWRGVPVHLVAGHDTASAVVAMGPPGGLDTAFASAGTWLLVGREQPGPELSELARAQNFTNEQAALGGIRFLKNLAGAWLLESCRPAWGATPVEALLARAATHPPGPTFDVTDPALLNPTDMAATIARLAGLGTSPSPTVVTRCIVDSLAVGVAQVLDELGGVGSLRIFGGASRWQALCERIEEVAAVPVQVGPVEATAIGNALVQGIALGLFSSLDDARKTLEEVATS